MERPIALGIIATDCTDVSSAFAVLYFLRSCRQRMRIQPKQAGAHNGVETGFLPPSGLIATDAPPARRICGIEWGFSAQVG